MNILSTQYNLPNRAFEIYIAGCNPPHCKGCFNPETWDFKLGTPFDSNYYQTRIMKKVKEFDSLIDNIFILGGEPLDQSLKQLKEFLQYINRLRKPIWLFTRYELTEIPIDIRILCEYIKCGKYDCTMAVDDYYAVGGLKLASTNQTVYKIKKELYKPLRT